jgi:hypothetical protein
MIMKAETAQLNAGSLAPSRGGVIHSDDED